MASAQSCPINDELNALRLEALRTGADGDISAYHQRLSLAFQRGELVSPHLCADKLAQAEAAGKVLTDAIVEREAELIYLRTHGKDGAVWRANHSKDVWRDLARAALDVQP